MRTPRPIRQSRRWLPGAINILVVAALLFAATFLPPDTSLGEVRRSGTLRVCVPQSAAPLVTGDPAAPGYDIEVLQHLAERLGLRLALNINPAIGRDFNPRNWRLTRAQCAVIAGGVVDSAATRGFLQLLPTGVETGWAAIVPPGEALGPVGTAAVLPGSQGLDRLALSGFLRENGIRTLAARAPGDLVAALETGAADIAISDRFTIATLALDEDARILWLPEPPFARFPLAFGLWKGDLTLRRALRDAMDAMGRDGTLASIAERYGLDGGPEDAADIGELFG
ncbi:substrate-binding periplasmic protein [Pelagibacterium lacus]|nr:transporter substrate-binding domain-containing protein [Pelagibacterium lacus]